MPVVTVKYKAAWGSGNVLVTAREMALVAGIGERMPRWLVDAMAEVWGESVIEEILVKLEPFPVMTINAPDLDVSVMFGKKWADYHQHATTFIALHVNEWLDQVVISQQRPSTNVEVILVDWHGVSFDRQGRLKNEW